MNAKLRKIVQMFGGKLVGTRKMQQQVCVVLSLLDSKIVKSLTKNCWFVSSMEDAWAFTLRGDELKDKHLIFLSDDLLSQSLTQIRYTIAHEIGHVVLDHRNSVFLMQTKEEISRQEKEADHFAKKFVSKK